MKKNAARTVLTVVGIVLCIVFGLALILNITIIVKGFTDPASPPSVFGVTPLVVQSGSMSIWNDADDHSAGNVVHKVFPEEIEDVSREEISLLKKGDVIWSYEEDYKVRNEVVSVVDAGQDGLWVNTIRLADDHIEVGDMIFSKKVDPSSLKVGDVISFLEDSVVVTHRIIKIYKADDGKLSFLTKGDANLSKDSAPISQDKVLGVYQWRIAKIGDLAMFMQTPIGMLLFIGIPLLAFILYDIIRRQLSSAKNEHKESDLAREKEEIEKKAAEMQAELERLRSLTNSQSAGRSGETPKEDSSPDDQGT